jgi:sugar-specific transcriptional regulator TrmB
LLEEENIEAFTSLGLTLVQTKVFLALAKVKNATIHEIANLSRVQRQDVYRIVSELEELGLVEKMLTAPVRFLAIGISEAVNVLLQQKKEEIGGLEQKSRSFLLRIEGNKPVDLQQNNEAQFYLVKGKTALLRNIMENVRRSTKIIDIATTQECFLQALDHLRALYAQKLGEGVKFRAITDKPVNKEAFFLGVGDIRRDSGLLLRYSSSPLKANVVIFDGSRAVAAMQTGAAWLKGPVIYTNNTAFLSMFRDYFSKAWNSGRSYNELEAH